MNICKFSAKWIGSIIFVVFLSSNAMAGKIKTYSEEDFLKSFSGKSNKMVVTAIGQPFKKELSVKPKDADSMVSMTAAASARAPQKPVKVEMWYYKNIVKYDAKNTYKMTELTFVNDRCMNIGFFNNK